MYVGEGRRELTLNRKGVVSATISGVFARHPPVGASRVLAEADGDLVVDGLGVADGLEGVFIPSDGLFKEVLVDDDTGMIDRHGGKQEGWTRGEEYVSYDNEAGGYW